MNRADQCFQHRVNVQDMSGIYRERFAPETKHQVQLHKHLGVSIKAAIGRREEVRVAGRPGDGGDRQPPRPRVRELPQRQQRARRLPQRVRRVLPVLRACPGG